ncbi:hypothetical protein FACS1894126_6250 [Alphaproteobacteria bacterium]|nr:hypothetical protein FACS1894126_6250 [Alphaproteobacteria bacterium]
MTIKRTEYLQKLKDFADKKLIKVITGIRRCGKSTLFEMFKDHLLKNNVSEKQRLLLDLQICHFQP